MSGRQAVVLTGGGARAAYQVGFLRCLARTLPDTPLPILTGVSAGALNATYLAARSGSLAEAVDELTELWRGLTPDDVFDVGRWPLLRNTVRWGTRLISGGRTGVPRARSLVDTAPLRRLILRSLGCVDGSVQGIAANLEQGRLLALALTAVNYATGQTCTFVQGSNIEAWQRPHRIGVKTRITADHVMASAALPLIFPAVRVGDAWYGDGGIRLFAPLSPAIHLGADRILAISTRYARSQEEAGRPTIVGYPPIAQVAGTLLNAIFLDAFDYDARRLEATNRLLAKLPRSQWNGQRPIRMLVLRPSEDLGRLAAEYETRLPSPFRYLAHGLGAHETESPDLLSLLLFQTEYTSRLIEIGERDAEARSEEIAQLLLDEGEG